MGILTGITAIGGAALAGVDVPAYMQYLGDSSMGGVAKFSVAFPFVFHYMIGLRHIQWDSNPEVLTTAGVTMSSYILAGAATVTSAALALC